MDDEPANLTVKHLSELHDEIREMMTQLNARFDGIESRMDGLATREDFGAAIGGVSGRIESLRREVAGYHSSFIEQRRLAGLENRMARIERCAEKNGWELGPLPR